MKKISNEIINQYLDSELDIGDSQEVKKLLSNSSKDEKEYLLLYQLDKNLKIMKAKRVSQNFTNNLMDKLSVRALRNRKQSIFILYIVVSLLIPLLVLSGAIIYNIFSNYILSTVDYSIINSVNTKISIWHLKFISYFTNTTFPILWIGFTFVLSIAIYFLLDELNRSRYYLEKIR